MGSWVRGLGAWVNELGVLGAAAGDLEGLRRLLAGSVLLWTPFQHDATRTTSLRDVHHDGFRGHRGRRWYRGDRGEGHHRDA